MRNIKVLQITHDLNIGGLQRVVVDLSKNLDKEVFQVGVLCLRDLGPLATELDEDNIPVFSIPHKSKKTDYLSFIKIFSIIKNFKPDVIHTHNTQPFIDGTLAALMARELAVPLSDSVNLSKQMDELFELKISEARFAGSIERDLEGIEATDWLESRY